MLLVNDRKIKSHQLYSLNYSKNICLIGIVAVNICEWLE